MNDTNVISCEKCEKLIRVPMKRGSINVQCPYCQTKIFWSPEFIITKKKCPNCGYRRQEKDNEYGIPLTECPKCGAIYEKVEKYLKEKERQEKERKEQEERELKAQQERYRKHLEKSSQLPIKKEWQHLNDNVVMFGIIIAVIIFAAWLENKFTEKQGNIKIISKEYQSPSIQFPHPPDIQNDSDMRRDIYDASRRATVDNKYSMDSQPRGLNNGGGIDDSLTRMRMEDKAREEAQRNVENDRLIQSHRASPYNDPVTNGMPGMGGINEGISDHSNHSEDDDNQIIITHRPHASPSPTIPRGAINVQTGEYYPPAAGGIIEPKTGTFMPDVGGGYIDSRTGKFIPKIGQ